MLSKLFILWLVTLSLFLSGCGGSRSTTVVIIEEPTPLQTYTINITKMSALNPVGDIYMRVFNEYGSDTTNTTSESIIITDEGDNLPITFQLKDSLGVILEKTFTLTSPELIDSTEVIVTHDIFEDNNFSFTFSIILQTKKQ